MTTGTNLLGLVSHLASVEAGYFGECLGRPWPEPMPWMAEDAEVNTDMWATADESPAEILNPTGASSRSPTRPSPNCPRRAGARALLEATGDDALPTAGSHDRRDGPARRPPGHPPGAARSYRNECDEY
jgi:hypothetical protein